MVTKAAEEHKSTSPTLSSMLNTENNTTKEYLPTPVTPVTDFVQFHVKKETTKNNSNGSAFSTFSIIKAPLSNTATNNPNATNAKPYSCPECHQTFSRPHNLKSHLTTHSSERPFQCEECHHHFRRHHDLKRHQKLHTGERPYVCSDCFRSFARLDALNRHRRAEGGTACTVVHQQVKKEIEKSTATTTITTTTPTTTTRPTIPQLHIPNPASNPFSTESKSTNTTTTTTSPPQQILPSPNALPTLPITNHYILKPILQSSKSLPSTPSSPPPKYHPYQPWSPRFSNNNNNNNNNNSRPTLPPLTNSPPADNGSPKEVLLVDKLILENNELKRDIDQIRAMTQKELSSLKAKIHDLEVENKVLRSLIHREPLVKQDEE